MRRQQTPDVTPNDVERIVRRDFPTEQFYAIMAVLGQYGGETWHREYARVQLAALKLANGSADRLKTAIRVAKSDYRDVIAPAEYPEYFKRGSRTRELPVHDQERVFDSDWEQYRKWLQK